MKIWAVSFQAFEQLKFKKNKQVSGAKCFGTDNIVRKKCASLNKDDQDVQTTSFQDLFPNQRFKSIVGMKGVKGSRQIPVVRNGDDPPPSTEIFRKRR